MSPESSAGMRDIPSTQMVKMLGGLVAKHSQEKATFPIDGGQPRELYVTQK